jgi:transposase
MSGLGPSPSPSSSATPGTLSGSQPPATYARYNATAPIEASSGPNVRHRLNPRSNRQLNRAIHMAAVTEIRHDTPGRAYYLRKLAEHKSRKEALRALKRRNQ